MCPFVHVGAYLCVCLHCLCTHQPASTHALPLSRRDRFSALAELLLAPCFCFLQNSMSGCNRVWASGCLCRTQAPAGSWPSGRGPSCPDASIRPQSSVPTQTHAVVPVLTCWIVHASFGTPTCSYAHPITLLLPSQGFLHSLPTSRPSAWAFLNSGWPSLLWDLIHPHFTCHLPGSGLKPQSLISHCRPALPPDATPRVRAPGLV